MRGFPPMCRCGTFCWPSPCSLGRFGVMLSMLVVAGSLAARKKRPISDSSFPVEGPTFGLLLLGIIFIVGALTYLPPCPSVPSWNSSR